MTPREIVRKLRANGGPLAICAADCIEELLAQIPASKPRGGIDPRHEAIVLLFRSRLNKPQRDAKEVRAFNAIKHLVEDADLKNLRRFYRQPDPKNFHQLLSARKKTPTTMMRDYINQRDLAEAWCEKNPPAPDPHETKFPEPEGWQKEAPGNLGQKSWRLICQQYPDIAADLHNQLNP